MGKKERVSASAKSFLQKRKSPSAKPKKRNVPSSDNCSDSVSVLYMPEGVVCSSGGEVGSLDGDISRSKDEAHSSEGDVCSSKLDIIVQSMILLAQRMNFYSSESDVRSFRG
jgi:hypothetical protein